MPRVRVVDAPTGRMGRPLLEWIAAHRTEALDAVFLGLTHLGHEPFLLFFVAVGYWLVDRRTFGRATAMLLVAALLNAYLKGVFQAPRPMVQPLIEADGWSFPSGHAQMAGALWLYLALVAGRARPWLATGLVLLALGVSASRPYLGVHYVRDVAVGLTLGALQVGLFAAWLRRPERLRRRVPSGAAVAALALLGWAAVRFGFDPAVQAGSMRMVGALVGLAIGLELAPDRFPAVPPQGGVTRMVMLGVGGAGILGLWLGLGLALRYGGLDDVLELQLVRYGLLGAWIAAGAPALVDAMSRRRADRTA